MGLDPISKPTNQQVLITGVSQHSLADKSKGMPGLLQKILYHTCLHIILKPLHKYSGLECPIVPISLLDAHGMIQPCIPMLMAWITDLEEVLDLLGLW